MTHGGHINGIAVGGIHLDASNALGIRQAHQGPVFTTVRGLVKAVPQRNAVANPGLAGAHPHCLRVFGINANGADALVVLVEDGLEGSAAID